MWFEHVYVTGDGRVNAGPVSWECAEGPTIASTAGESFRRY